MKLKIILPYLLGEKTRELTILMGQKGGDVKAVVAQRCVSTTLR